MARLVHCVLCAMFHTLRAAGSIRTIMSKKYSNMQTNNKEATQTGKDPLYKTDWGFILLLTVIVLLYHGWFLLRE